MKINEEKLIEEGRNIINKMYREKKLGSYEWDLLWELLGRLNLKLVYNCTHVSEELDRKLFEDC